MTLTLRRITGPIKSRMMKLVEFQKLQIPVSSGSEPVVESIDDCTEVYGDGDNVIDLFPEVSVPCDVAPAGECEWNALLPEPELYRCLHCKRMTGA